MGLSREQFTRRMLAVEPEQLAQRLEILFARLG